MSPEPATITVDTAVAASAEAVYGLITDLPTLAQLGEEVAEMRWTTGDSAAAGNVFRGRNRNGWHRWSTTCTVTEADPGRAFAFDVSRLGFPIARWRYEITADGEGSRVTESMWDRRPPWLKSTAYLLTGVSDRETANAEHMRVTLQRLKARAEAG